MKTGLTVIGVLAAVIVLMLIIPLRAKFAHKNGETSLILRYLFLKWTILPDEKEEMTETAAETAEKTFKKAKKAKEKPNIKELFPVILDALPKCIAPVRKLLKRTTIAHLDLYMLIVGEDAADTAIRFGRMNSVIFPVIKLLSEIFTVKYDRIELAPGFTAEEENTECSFTVRLIPLAALTAAVNLGIIALGAFIRAEKNKPIERKSQHGKEQPAHQ